MARAIDYADPRYSEYADKIVDIAPGDCWLDYPEGDDAECDRLIALNMACHGTWAERN